MPSHFSTIGLPIESEQEMLELAKKASEEAREIPCSYGYYLKWSSAEGAELWLHIDNDNNLVGLTPSFSGESTIKIAITHAISRPDDSDFEGMIHGWANPKPDEVNSGDYPFVFDLVDKAAYDNLQLPLIANISISAFAHELTAYDSEEDYNASQQEQEAKFASRSFFPTGLFNDDDNALPQPYAMFTGKVLKTKLCTNPLTGKHYQWALVETLGGIFDVVADPEISEKPIQIGGIVSGSFWLNGKIHIPYSKPKTSFFAKLFSK